MYDLFLVILKLGGFTEWKTTMMMTQAYKIEKLSSNFKSCGIQCSGDLYLPLGVESPPVIIMAHGLSFERSFGLQSYAEYFVHKGCAVYLFDYRCFGDSEGEPRNYVDPNRHIQDWQAAIAHIRSLPNVNTSRIALWGTSFSGGHVIVVAAQDQKIAAIVIQAPFVDSITTIQKLGARYILQAIPHALRDLSRIITFRPPYYVKALGNPDEFAVVNTPGSLAGALAIIPPGYNWQNHCPARILLTILFYRPIAWASKVKCPALIQYGKDDSLIDPQSVRKTAERMLNSSIIDYPLGHFDFYKGKAFNEVVAKQITFLIRYLS